jgi:16S rRNA (cytosine967-C5)-methyltransferase
VVLDLVVPPLTRVFEEGARADRELRRTLRAHPDLDDDGRRAVADALLGTCVQRARVDHHLAAAGAPANARNRVAMYLRLFRAQRVLDAPWLERAAEAPLPAEPFERLVVERSLPRWLARRLVDERGLEEADALLRAVNEPGPVVARANTLKTDRQGLLAALREEGVDGAPGRLTSWSVRLDGRPNIHGSTAWRTGLFEVQDEGSQVIALETGAAPGETVVDLCAGRGGKTLALAAMMQNAGRLLAFDVDDARLSDLAPRLVRAGVECATVDRLSPDGAAPTTLHEAADLVLVDAPCSQVGTLRRSPDLRWQLQESELAAAVALQRSILDGGAKLVRPGGRLVYATCTLLLSENEELVRGFLADRPTFALTKERSLLPHVDDTDGFYVACLERLP